MPAILKSVYIFTVGNGIYFDFSGGLVDCKKDSVISHSDSIALTAMEFFNPGREWILF